MPGGSPVKAAQEVTRILRDQMRGVIEFGGLTMQSFIDFQVEHAWPHQPYRGRAYRRFVPRQLLGTAGRGCGACPFGPHAELSDGRRWRRGDDTFNDPCRPAEANVHHVVRGHLDLPSLARSSITTPESPLYEGSSDPVQLRRHMVGSVAISGDFHPFDAEGRMQSNLSMLGVLTEGVRYFTHYLPSPRSRLRAVYDAQATVEAIIG